jgi:hypothetical protein
MLGSGGGPNESERDTRKPDSRASPMNTSSLATFAERLGRERPDTQNRMTSNPPSPTKPSSSRTQQTPTNANGRFSFYPVLVQYLSDFLLQTHGTPVKVAHLPFCQVKLRILVKSLEKMVIHRMESLRCSLKDPMARTTRQSL